MMSLETEIITVIQTLGFPVFVTLWFMFRTEKVINKNTEAMITIGEVVAKCQKK